MTMTPWSPNYPSDWLKSESDSDYSRDQAVVAAGQGRLVTGTVLGRRTADSKLAVLNPLATDGTQIAAAILFDRAVDATSADQPVEVVTRHAVVGHAGLVWGPAVNTAQLRATAAQQLKAKGIVDRQAA